MLTDPSKRMLLKSLGISPLAWALSSKVGAQQMTPLKKAIPTSGEHVAAVGLGTSRTFDVKLNDALMPQLQNVLQAFFDHGGQLIDSSPMYGAAETVTGTLLKGVKNSGELFAATKVWTDGRDAGIAQMHESMQKMNVAVMDLMQIHNLRDWKTHLPTLREWKEEGKIRYLGITTSHGRFHNELMTIMKTEPLDFVQFSYNLANREVEPTLLSIAAERGIATLINRPFQRGDLFRQVKGRALPAWAGEIDCATWGQIFLKYVISHPAVTSVIPATSKLKHMLDNMAAGFGRMPDAQMRLTMERHFGAI